MGKLAELRKIIRYHNTQPENVQGILDNGVKNVKKYYSTGVLKRSGAYTTASPNRWRSEERPVQFELAIPKEWYKEHSQFATHDLQFPEDVEGKFPWMRYNNENSDGYHMKGVPRVYQGGHTSIFDADIPKEFIKMVCFDNRKNCFEPGNIPEEYLK